MRQSSHLSSGNAALVMVAEIAAYIVHYIGHLRIAQLNRQKIHELTLRLTLRLTECGHAVFAVEHGQCHVLPGHERWVAGQLGVMSGTDGALRPRHVASLANMTIDIRPAESA